MNPHITKPKRSSEIEPDYKEYRLFNSEVIHKTRYFIQCLIQDRGNLYLQLIGSFDYFINECIDESARSTTIPETIITQLDHFYKVFENPPEHYYMLAQYARAFCRDFVKRVPFRPDPRSVAATEASADSLTTEIADETSYPTRTRSNHLFSRNMDELIHRLRKWKVFLEKKIECSSRSTLPMFGFNYLSSYLPSLHVPTCYSVKGTAVRMQSITHFAVDLHDDSYRWNSFRIKDEFGHFHYFSLVKERPMDLIYSFSAELLAHFLSTPFQKVPNIAKRVDLSHRYNMLPLNAVTMLTERSRNELSLSEMMRSILKKKGVKMDEFLSAIAEIKRTNASKLSPSELDASVSMEGEVRDYL